MIALNNLAHICRLMNNYKEALETINLVKQEQTVFLTLKKQLDQYIQKAQQYKLRSYFEGDIGTNILSKEDKEKLESLSYVQ